jgi:hypothetical protein
MKFKIPIFAVAMGGLGNQMFIMTTGLLVAKQQKRKLYIITNWFYRRQRESFLQEYERNLEILKFPMIENSFILQSRTLNFILFNYYKLGLRLRSWQKFIGVVNMDTSRTKIKWALVIHGAMQSDKGYAENKNMIHNLYKLSQNDEQKIFDRVDNFRDNSQALVAMHIRRGDLAIPGNIANLLPVAYFKEALNQFDTSNFKFLVFSDDILWCKQFFSGNHFFFISETDPVFSLRMMNLCDHYILSSSTFGWWGAWLNDRDNSKVIFPQIMDPESEACIMKVCAQSRWTGIPTNFVYFEEL